ncbi:MAG: hypothetical protein ACI4TK_09865 [Agathobacter sp.]
MDYNFEVRRIVRKNEYEKWLIYTTFGLEDVSCDTVYIFWEDNNCEVFLFNENDKLLNNEKYFLSIECLYHDIGIMEDDELVHDLKIVNIPLEIQHNDEKTTNYIYDYLFQLGKTNVL